MSAMEHVVGGTPLIPLPALSERTGHRVLGKCEFLNANGSIKDRIAVAMVNAAEAAGHLKRGASTIVEATGGNTGVALAAIAAARGYGIVVTLSSKMGKEKIALLRAYGAEVHVCPYEVPPDSPDHFINRARAIARERSHHHFIDQFNNRANPFTHEMTTGPEIWRQADGPVHAVVAGVGTGGTLMGIARYVRSNSLSARIVLADPLGSVLASAVNGEPAQPRPYRTEGIGGDFLPPLFDPSQVDAALTVSDDESDAECRWMLRNEGLLLGGSSGCTVATCVRFARTLLANRKTIVVILADSGRNYIENIYCRTAENWGSSEISCLSASRGTR